MNFFESAYSSNGKDSITEQLKFRAPSEVSRLVYDAYDNNKGSLRISITTTFRDKDGVEHTEEQIFDIPKREIKL